MAAEDPASGDWHWDRRIPIALIVTIALQTIALAFWIGTLAQRVSSLEETRSAQMDGPGRVIRVETRLDDVQRTLDKLDVKIDRLINRGTSP